MRFIETVASKLLHQIKNLVGFFFCNGVFRSTITEDLAVLGHFIGVFFTHGATQHVSATQ